MTRMGSPPSPSPLTLASATSTRSTTPAGWRIITARTFSGPTSWPPWPLDPRDFEWPEASFTLGRVLETRGYDGVGEPWNLVLSATLDIAEGLTLAGDVAYFDNDLERGAREPTGGDRGFVWVTQVAASF